MGFFVADFSTPSTVDFDDNLREIDRRSSDGASVGGSLAPGPEVLDADKVEEENLVDLGDVSASDSTMISFDFFFDFSMVLARPESSTRGDISVVLSISLCFPLLEEMMAE